LYLQRGFKVKYQEFLNHDLEKVMQSFFLKGTPGTKEVTKLLGYGF
jgi:hypothetical protein